MTLYGFLTQEQKTMFEKLLSISGIGPKAAASVLSVMRVNDIAAAVISNDDKAFTNVPGIGKKTAQRLVLELKEKVDSRALSQAAPQLPEQGAAASAMQEAVRALMALGYSSAEASRAVGAAGSAGSVEEIIVAALRGLDTGR